MLSETKTARPVCPVIVERARVILVLGSRLRQRLTCLVMLDKYNCPVKFPGEPCSQTLYYVLFGCPRNSTGPLDISTCVQRQFDRKVEGCCSIKTYRYMTRAASRPRQVLYLLLLRCPWRMAGAFSLKMAATAGSSLNF